MIYRANDRQYSPDTIEPIPELIEDDDSLTCSISDNVTCMANEDSLLPQHGGMLLLKSTTSSLDTSFTELSSPHEVNLSNKILVLNTKQTYSTVQLSCCLFSFTF